MGLADIFASSHVGLFPSTPGLPVVSPDRVSSGRNSGNCLPDEVLWQALNVRLQSQRSNVIVEEATGPGRSTVCLSEYSVVQNPYVQTDTVTILEYIHDNVTGPDAVRESQRRCQSQLGIARPSCVGLIPGNSTEQAFHLRHEASDRIFNRWECYLAARFSWLYHFHTPPVGFKPRPTHPLHRPASHTDTSRESCHDFHRQPHPV